MKIGFSGTRQGMTIAQKRMVRQYLEGVQITEAHHGDCIGADEEFHGLLISLKAPKIFIHPGMNYRGECPTRSHCDEHSPGDGTTVIEVLEPEPFIIRDKKIVDIAHFLLATPKGMKEELRSGTWTTIRYSRKLNYQTVIVWPDGSIQFD